MQPPKLPEKVDFMPQVTVKYLMTFSQVTGKKKESVAIQEGATVKDLLQVLYNSYGRKFKKLIEQDLENRSVVFSINGEAKDITTELHDDDEVLISFPVGGG
jgi:MoaD family protein